MQMINRKQFAAAILALNNKAFMIYITYLESKMSIYLAWNAKMALLLAEKVSIPKKYTNFLDIFFKKSAAKLSNRSDISKHTINLEPSNQPIYKQIYSLGPVELKTLKTYIKTKMTNRFIKLYKFVIGALTFFVQKLDKSLNLCINYRGLNNLIIKN